VWQPRKLKVTGKGARKLLRKRDSIWREIRDRITAGTMFTAWTSSEAEAVYGGDLAERGRKGIVVRLTEDYATDPNWTGFDWDLMHKLVIVPVMQRAIVVIKRFARAYPTRPDGAARTKDTTWYHAELVCDASEDDPNTYRVGAVLYLYHEGAARSVTC